MSKKVIVINESHPIYQFTDACHGNNLDKAKKIVSDNPTFVDKFYNNEYILNGFYNVCHYGNIEFAKFMLSLDKNFNKHINFARAYRCYCPDRYDGDVRFHEWISKLDMEDIL